MSTRSDEFEDGGRTADDGDPRAGASTGAAPGAIAALPGERPVDELDYARARASVMAGLFGGSAPGSSALAGRYELLEALGSGGFGLVYRARDRERDTIVALKVLHNAAAPLISRFKREFRSLADIVHPNLVTLYELHFDPDHGLGQWFFTMQLVDGVDFLTHVRGPPTRQNDRASAFAEEPTVPRGLEADDATRSASTGATRSRDAVSTGVGAVVDAGDDAGDDGGARALDHDEVRRCLAQLANGVAALHAAGKIHRDLKPSNVLVDRTGKVVILDFGLVVDLAADASSLRSSPVAGTPAYMAPEQALGEPASFAGDWYSVGVMLFEALTGRRPHDGHPARILRDRVRLAPPDPRSLAPELPAELATLCVDLLRVEPGRRPDADAVLRRLGHAPARGRGAAVDSAGARTKGESSGAMSSLSARAPAGARGSFVGRGRELRRLQLALASAIEGRCVTALVHGASGIGKSTLVRRFRAYLRTADRDALVLSGRCYEQESVPFKALDGVVDALSHALARLPDEEVTALVPRGGIAALARLFPTLTQVPAIRRACAGAADHGAPRSQQLRTRAAQALRQLFARISARRLLAVVIDDLHWGDEDSAALLAELLRGPTPPPILLVLSYRTGELASNKPLARLLAGAARSPEVDRHEVELAPLSVADARALVRRLARPEAPGDGSEVLEAIVRESGGHPLFIHELVRGVDARSDMSFGAGASPRLDDVLWARLQRLPADARRIVEIVCVAGRPIAEARACRAASAHAGRGDALARLRVGHFLRVRVDEAAGERVIEAYHDRVRETVTGRLARDVRRRHHARLADEYASGTPDHEALARHLRAAGEVARAAQHAALAGARAHEAMAFERAVGLLRQALAEGVHEPGERRALTVQLAGALVDAGRATEAGDLYLQVASEFPPERAFDLRRRASAQLYRAGHLERGFAVLHKVLGDLGEHLPSTPARAVYRYVWHRAHVVRALNRELRRPPRRSSGRALDTVTRARLETYRSLATTLGMIDTMRGAVYQVQHLRLALRTGDPLHTALAIALEAPFSAVTGSRNRRRAAELLARAQLMAEAIGEPFVHGYIGVCRGMVALLVGQYDVARAESERAEKFLLERCVGVAWEIATVRSTLGTGLLYTGRWNTLARWLPRLLEEADDRGDRYARAILETQLLFAVELARDDVERARDNAARALARWPRGSFQLPSFFNLTSRGEIELYAGDGRRAHELVESVWPRFQRSMLIRTEINRLQGLLLRARCNLAITSCVPRRSAKRDAHLRAALRQARMAARPGTEWAVAYADAIRGGVAAAKGRVFEASEHLLRAEDGLRSAALELHAAAARRQRGALVGGGTGAELVRTADAAMVARGVAVPARMAEGLIPVPRP